MQATYPKILHGEAGNNDTIMMPAHIRRHIVASPYASRHINQQHITDMQYRGKLLLLCCWCVLQSFLLRDASHASRTFNGHTAVATLDFGILGLCAYIKTTTPITFDISSTVRGCVFMVRNGCQLCFCSRLLTYYGFWARLLMHAPPAYPWPIASRHWMIAKY